MIPQSSANTVEGFTCLFLQRNVSIETLLDITVKLCSHLQHRLHRKTYFISPQLTRAAVSELSCRLDWLSRPPPSAASSHSNSSSFHSSTQKTTSSSSASFSSSTTSPSLFQNIISSPPPTAPRLVHLIEFLNSVPHNISNFIDITKAGSVMTRLKTEPNLYNLIYDMWGRGKNSTVVFTTNYLAARFAMSPDLPINSSRLAWIVKAKYRLRLLLQTMGCYFFFATIPINLLPITKYSNEVFDNTLQNHWRHSLNLLELDPDPSPIIRQFEAAENITLPIVLPPPIPHHTFSPGEILERLLD